MEYIFQNSSKIHDFSFVTRRMKSFMIISRIKERTIGILNSSEALRFEKLVRYEHERDVLHTFTWPKFGFYFHFRIKIFIVIEFWLIIEIFMLRISFISIGYIIFWETWNNEMYRILLRSTALIKLLMIRPNVEKTAIVDCLHNFSSWSRIFALVRHRDGLHSVMLYGR